MLKITITVCALLVTTMAANAQSQYVWNGVQWVVVNGPMIANRSQYVVGNSGRNLYHGVQQGFRQPPRPLAQPFMYRPQYAPPRYIRRY